MDIKGFEDIHQNNNKKIESNVFSESDEWNLVEKEASRFSSISLRKLFIEKPERVDSFSIGACGIYLDYSKNLIDERAISALLKLLNARRFDNWRDRMFLGDVVNHTEQRAVAHSALRAFSQGPLFIDKRDVLIDMRNQLKKMRVFVDAVRSGKWTGHTGKPIRSIVNIGIGGSDLGPKLVTEALFPYRGNQFDIHYVSNIDGSAIHQALAACDPEQTLFIICSKSFTTAETLSNAQAARQWFIQRGGNDKVLHKHFVAVTSNKAEANKFGIHPDQQFEMWDWVGGRFSLWSSIGVSTALVVGMGPFIDLLKGAENMDLHFMATPPEKNMPVIMALLSVWYSSFMGAQTQAIVPYDHYLRYLPEYLQQLEMESNGKRIDRSGEAVSYCTAPIIWGTAGTNGQHSYFQLIHQGGKLIPSDFILVRDSHNPVGNNHKQLLANGIAQMEALMKGRTEAEARADMRSRGMSHDEIERLLPYKTFPGNQPSNALVIDKLTPYALGALLAAYEHKTFTQGVMWNLNSFDQWGVEYGKQLACKIMDEIDEDKHIVRRHDSSTTALIQRLLAP